MVCLHYIGLLSHLFHSLNSLDLFNVYQSTKVGNQLTQKQYRVKVMVLFSTLVSILVKSFCPDCKTTGKANPLTQKSERNVYVRVYLDSNYYLRPVSYLSIKGNFYRKIKISHRGQVHSRKNKYSIKTYNAQMAGWRLNPVQTDIDFAFPALLPVRLWPEIYGAWSCNCSLTYTL